MPLFLAQRTVSRPVLARPSQGVGTSLQLWVLGALASCALLPACGDGGGSPAAEAPAEEAAAGAPEYPEYPEGTAFAIGGTPVLKEEIDAYVPLMRLIDPHLVQSSLRRNAIANVILPIAAGKSLDPAAREEAFQRAQRLNTAARETGQVPPDGPEPRFLTGTWKEVGLVPFNEARETPVGDYSRLTESPAAWTFFKLIATNIEEGAAFDSHTQVTIARYDVPYLPDEAAMELLQQAIDTLPIEIVDEEWEHVIPPINIYKPKADR